MVKRPENLNEIIGNKLVIESLRTIFQSENKPHTYLFHGPAGCGKTTLARILTKELGCKYHGLVEINSSNNRGIDSARDIVDQCIYAPLEGEVKVYILDEVHKATNEFQNAMLKVLEEPPDHVYFILCTTDPQKLLRAIQSRCTAFAVTPPKHEELYNYLIKICQDNNINIDEKIIETIVMESLCIPRDALKMLEKIKDIKNSSPEEIIAFLKNDIDNPEEVIVICRLLTNLNTTWDKMSAVLKKNVSEPESVRRAVLGYCQAVLLNKQSDRAYQIIECFKNHFYDSGKAGLVAACYKIIND